MSIEEMKQAYEFVEMIWREKHLSEWELEQQEVVSELLRKAIVEAEQTQPDWRHPKIQGLIASDARSRIVIDLIWQLIDNPECELTAMDMEYWSSIHDALKDRLTKSVSHQRTPLTDEQIMQRYETSGHQQALRPQDRFAVLSFARAIEKAHGIVVEK